MGSCPQDRACYLTEQRRGGHWLPWGVRWPPGDTRHSLQLRGGQRWLVPATMVPFRRQDAAEMSSRASDLSWQVSRALRELLVLWAAARGQDSTSPNPAEMSHPVSELEPGVGR